MARTSGFTCSLANAITIGVPFSDPANSATLVTSSYLIIPTAGTEGGIVYVNGQGALQYCAYAFVGYNPISASQVVASGTVGGVMRTTTAVPTGWLADYVN